VLRKHGEVEKGSRENLDVPRSRDGALCPASLFDGSTHRSFIEATPLF
jgi:hypothetical protein